MANTKTAYCSLCGKPEIAPCADLHAQIAKLVEALEKIVSVYEAGDGVCLDLRLADIARKALTSHAKH